MSDTSTERRMELIHQARSQSYKNQSDFMNREQKEEENTFKFRLAIAGILLLLVILFDISDKSFVGISTEQVFQAIATDYGEDVAAWIATSTR